jgi:multiple sugar transport system substrate-binding protein
MNHARFRLIICAVVMVLCAATVPGQPPAGQKVSLDFWHYFGGDHDKTLKELIARFQADNPNIEIRPVYQGRPQELSQKLQGSFAATPANNPVLATVYENWTSDFVSKGLMDAVEDHFGGPDGLSAEERDDIIKVFREANSWDGKMVTMPFNKSMYVLYVNADMLSKAGFTTAPATRDEFKAAVAKTTVAEKTRVKTYGLGSAPSSEAFTTHFFAAGGEYFDKSGNFLLDSPEAVAALTLLRDLQYPNKQIYVSTDYMNVPFGNQQIAMYIYSSASFPYNERAVAGKFKWGVAPIPGQPGKEPGYLMQGTNVGIFKNKPEEQRAAAWRFLKFLTGTKSSVLWETRTGYMPIRYSVLKDPEMKAYMEKNPNYATAAALVLADKGKQEPKIAAWEAIRLDMEAMVDRVLSKGADPKTELTATKAKALERLKQTERK